MIKRLLHLSAFFALTLPLSAAWQSERRLASPGGELVFLLERDDATGTLAWSVTHADRSVVTRGALCIEISGSGVIAATGTVSNGKARSVDTTWNPPYGERCTIPDKFREETFTVNLAGQGSLTAKLQVRAYAEGIAFRYLIGGTGAFTVTSEKTTFPLSADATVWTSTTAQGKITRQAVSAINGAVDRPLTAELAPDLFAAFGEAALVNQARMKFVLQGKSTLLVSLDGPESFTNELATPWRYVRAANSPSALLEGDYFMLNLNEPNKIGDTAWLRPGKVLREVTLTTQGSLACIDYAAAHHLQFIMFDAGWYGPENSPASDATKVTVDPKRSPGPLDLAKVIAAAKSKDIGVILYVNHRALEKQLDQLLPLYEQWGVAGIKFGFVNVGSQEWTTWLHAAIAKCARHHLMVDVHDEYRMTGVARTLPNFMTAEGVRGDEESPKNEEVLNTLFTRSLAGPADQTDCYFASRVSAMGSHASQLAKPVCIYSPWLSAFWYDRPPGAPGVGGGGGNVSVIQDVPEIGFFERLPTVWDETRAVDGYPGSHAVIARRSGKVWFIGALNGVAPREFKIPLAFLDAGKQYRLELYSDDPSVNTPTRVRIETSDVNRQSVIQRSVASRNGLAAILTPEPVAVKSAP